MTKFLSNTFVQIFKYSLFLGFIFLTNYLLACTDCNGQSVGALHLKMISDASESTLFQTITYKMSVTNTGTEEKSNITVNAETPVGTVFAKAATASGHYDRFTGRWILDPLAANVTVDLELAVTVIDPTAQIIHYSFFDFSEKENLVMEFGSKKASFDDRISITVLPKDEPAPSDFMKLENPDFIKEKKEGIWKMYPLVADEKLTIELMNRSKVGDFAFDVLDENGAVVFRQESYLKRGKTEAKIDLEFVRPGKYLLKVQGKEGKFWEADFWKK